MTKNLFQFKKFSIQQDISGMKVGTDGVLLGAWADVTNSKSIIDIGTGTGLIALMTAQRSQGKVIAIEPDSNSFKEAVININKSDWESRIEVVNTTIQDYSASKELKFDHIISNPPYFNNSLQSINKSRSIARHTVSLTFEELINSVSLLLQDDGKFSFIIPSDQESTITIQANKLGLFCKRKLYIKPKPTLNTKRVLMEFTFFNTICNEETITIENCKRHDYTKEYKSLTKDFYLKF